MEGSSSARLPHEFADAFTGVQFVQQKIRVQGRL